VTEGERLKALVAYRLEQSAEALRAAELNVANGLDRSAANRAYYATRTVPALAFLRGVRALPTMVVSSTDDAEERATTRWVMRYRDHRFRLRTPSASSSWKTGGSRRR